MNFDSQKAAFEWTNNNLLQKQAVANQIFKQEPRFFGCAQRKFVGAGRE